MILAGVVLGAWVGVGWAFIGGIVDVVTALKVEDVVALDLAFGIFKIMFAGVIGWVSALALIVPGFITLSMD